VRRHGKWLIFKIKVRPGTHALAVNLGMSGRFEILKPKTVPKHTRWRILVSTQDGERVINYVDPRCMGRIRLLDAYDTISALRTTSAADGIDGLNLGPDWLSPLLVHKDIKVRMREIRSRICDGLLPIKATLLDQSRLAGLGNIYASEMCYYMGTHPLRPANELTDYHLKRLAKQCPVVLREAISKGGTSLGDANSFVDAHNIEGTYSSKLRVYGRTHKKCFGCNNKIEKIVLKGRSTFFCSSCQT